jgi:hypothetical protein
MEHAATLFALMAKANILLIVNLSYSIGVP